MNTVNTRMLSRIPSMRSLFIFNVVARHLNLVRAAEDLCLTQSALSRQLKGLEAHLGVVLFERGPRGLRFTQEGELLYDFTTRAFSLMSEGIGRLGISPERSSLVVSVARSFAERVLASRLAEFSDRYPQIDLQIDVHRYFADLESSGADISIRLGRDDWTEYESVRLTDDRLFPVCAPAVGERIAGAGEVAADIVLLRNQEREYLDAWNAGAAGGKIPMEGRRVICFNDSSTLLAALESGTGITVTRASLVGEALERGLLVRPFAESIHDAMHYHAVCAQRSSHKIAVRLFMDWLRAAFPAGGPEGGAGAPA